MTREELEKRLNEVEKQNFSLLNEVKSLKEKLIEIKDEPEIPDFPEFARPETFWCAGLDFKHVDSGYAAGGTSYYDYNCFHTKEMAQEFAKKCRLIAMMLHCKWYLCRDFKGDYSCSNDKWVVYYNKVNNKFSTSTLIRCDYGLVSFDTKENAQECADWINEHWVE